VAVPGSVLGGTGMMGLKIVSLSFRAANADSVFFRRFSVRMGAMAGDSLGQNFAGNFAGEAAVVFQKDSVVIGPDQGWITIPLDTAYVFRGSENLLVEIINSGADDGLLYCGYWETEDARTVYSENHSAASGASYRFSPHLYLDGRVFLDAGLFFEPDAGN
jgi:hypothetical protein